MSISLRTSSHPPSPGTCFRVLERYSCSFQDEPKPYTKAVPNAPPLLWASPSSAPKYQFPIFPWDWRWTWWSTARCICRHDSPKSLWSLDLCLPCLPPPCTICADSDAPVSRTSPFQAMRGDSGEWALEIPQESLVSSWSPLDATAASEDMNGLVWSTRFQAPIDIPFLLYEDTRVDRHIDIFDWTM